MNLKATPKTGGGSGVLVGGGTATRMVLTPSNADLVIGSTYRLMARYMRTQVG